MSHHHRKISPPPGVSIEPCVEAFGVDRCMFESNFPPDKQSGGCTELWNAFKRITSGASATEKTALYCGTAARVYRMIIP
jgi:L-fuconolactonase